MPTFYISNLPQSPDIGQNSDWGISDFRASGQSLIKENFHNSTTSNNIEMKPGSLTTNDKRNRQPLKTNDNNVVSANRDAIVIFSIYDQFGVIWKPDSGLIVCKIYMFFNSNLLSKKNWSQN